MTKRTKRVQVRDKNDSPKSKRLRQRKWLSKKQLAERQKALDGAADTLQLLAHVLTEMAVRVRAGDKTMVEILNVAEKKQILNRVVADLM